jgi:hypothetical protein
MPRPAFAGETAPVRTVRVELAAGNRSVVAAGVNMLNFIRFQNVW